MPTLTFLDSCYFPVDLKTVIDIWNINEEVLLRDREECKQVELFGIYTKYYSLNISD